MVRDRLTDGTRIAQLLASEIYGRETGPLGQLTVVDADRDVNPTEFGSFAYGVDIPQIAKHDDDIDPMDLRLADVYVHPNRVHLEFRVAVDTAADAGTSAGLRTRPKAVDPPRTIVFVEAGAEVKRATDVLAAVFDSFRPTMDDGY